MTENAERKSDNVKMSTNAVVSFKNMLNFRKIWLLNFLLTSGFAIIPLIFFAVIDYQVTQRSVESEVILRVSRFTSNVWRSVSFFLDERESALEFAVHDNSFQALTDPERLAELLENLKIGFGGFSDIGVVDATGYQRAYVGPYNLLGKDYSGQDWFKDVMERGKHISDVFLGYRNKPHLVIAVKHVLPDGTVYILRATVENRFGGMLTSMESDEQSDTFLVNRGGILQTASVYFGDALQKIPIPVPEYSERTRVIEGKAPDGANIIIGYAYIPATPYILMVIKQKSAIMMSWRQTRMELIGYLVVSITVILLWILGVTFYMVSRLKIIDRNRLRNLHMAEYSNKLASIGRLAAGVAHEVNNPLAIINEKAGLIKDLFTYKKEYADDPKLIATIDTIQKSVERCSRITRRLLRFARHMDVSIQSINLKELIQEVLGFQEKEAEYRSIDVRIDIPENIPEFKSDRGKLQQIFLNLLNNSFAALSDGGRLEIIARKHRDGFISITVSDNGHGIASEDLKRVFEPFFSTKVESGGTGLGLSITYGLINELGGRIEVESELNKGTRFIVFLPLEFKEKEGQTYANLTG